MVSSVFLKQKDKQIFGIGFPESACLWCCEKMLSSGALDSCQLHLEAFVCLILCTLLKSSLVFSVSKYVPVCLLLLIWVIGIPCASFQVTFVSAYLKLLEVSLYFKYAREKIYCTLPAFEGEKLTVTCVTKT